MAPHAFLPVLLDPVAAAGGGVTPGPDSPETADAVFAALAHTDRRRILDLLAAHPGMTVGAVASHFPVSQVAIIKHLNKLERADLVISEKDGRSRRLYFNPMPIQAIYDRWTDQYTRFWGGHIADIKRNVEARASAKEDTKRA